MTEGHTAYNMNFWYYQMTNCPGFMCNRHENCISKTICIKNPVKERKLKNTETRHKVVVTDIQPVKSPDATCTMMNLENLAYPQWISVPCKTKMITE